MRIRNAMVLAAAGATFGGCTSQTAPFADEEAIRATSASWQAFDETQNAAGVATLFAADGSVWWEDRDPATGTEAITAFMTESYALNPNGIGSWGPEHIEVAASGDLAVESGAWQNGDNHGRYLTVHRKVDGVWKVSADMSLSTSSDGGAPEWARTWSRRWYDAYNARDAQALADLYTNDAHVGEAAHGRAAIMALFESGWAEDNDTCMGQYDGFEIVGPVATAWGRDTCATAAAEGSSGTVRFRWIAHFEQQADGNWLATRDFGQSIE
jgi:ketosteroid isomerase-like protein